MKKFSFVKNQKIFFCIVLVMVVIGIASFIIRGFNFDIDFVGGSEISYDLGKTVTKDDEAKIADIVTGIIGADKFSAVRVSGDQNNIVTLRTLVIDNDDTTEATKNAIDEAVKALYPDVILSDASTDTVRIFNLPQEEEETTPLFPDDAEEKVTEALASVNAENLNVLVDMDALNVSFDSSSVIGKMRADIDKAILAEYDTAVWRSTDSVSAEVSAGLKATAIKATIIAVILMLVYIAFRFQISSAFAAILCLAHDLFIMITAYSLFQIPVNSTIIAALLTILGYSINATIIIFDRIRENDKKMGSSVPFADKVDDGIRATFTRSLNTTLTTLFTIGMIYFLGVTSIKNFALPLIVGIVAGLFSSVCLAGPLWNLIKKIKIGKR